MCGRFTLTMDAETFEHAMRDTYGLDIETADLALPRYNIAPGQKVLALIHDGESYRLGHLEWGMPMKGSGSTLINARAESIHEKPMFKDAFNRRRCLILADGYYEWKKGPTGKTPMRILPSSRRLFTMAGVYQSFKEKDGSRTHRCAIVTTEANPDVSGIHHRMPLILEGREEATWVHPSHHGSTDFLRTLLEPPEGGTLEHYPVDPLVNNPANDTPACIQAASTDPSPTLFNPH